MRSNEMDLIQIRDQISSARPVYLQAFLDVFFSLYDADRTIDLDNFFLAVQKKAPVKLLLGHDTPGSGRDDWTFQSDHGAFHREKIPFIYFGVEDHKDYHRPTDDFLSIQPEFYVRAVETIVEALRELDEASIRPIVK